MPLEKHEHMVCIKMNTSWLLFIHFDTLLVHDVDLMTKNCFIFLFKYVRFWQHQEIYGRGFKSSSFHSEVGVN